METTWKIEPQFIREMLDGRRPFAHSLKCAVKDIQGQHVKLSFAFCDCNDETLCIINTEYLMLGSILTLRHLERSFNVTLSEA